MEATDVGYQGDATVQPDIEEVHVGRPIELGAEQTGRSEENLT